MSSGGTNVTYVYITTICGWCQQQNMYKNTEIAYQKYKCPMTDDHGLLCIHIRGRFKSLLWCIQQVQAQNVVNS